MGFELGVWIPAQLSRPSDQDAAACPVWQQEACAGPAPGLTGAASPSAEGETLRREEVAAHFTGVSASLRWSGARPAASEACPWMMGEEMEHAWKCRGSLV